MILLNYSNVQIYNPGYHDVIHFYEFIKANKCVQMLVKIPFFKLFKSTVDNNMFTINLIYLLIMIYILNFIFMKTSTLVQFIQVF